MRLSGRGWELDIKGALGDWELDNAIEEGVEWRERWQEELRGAIGLRWR
jgi:hypothetical protein